MKKKTVKTLDECRSNIQKFANRFKLIFEDEGEVGFGRECVGLTNGNNWVDYNPTKDLEYIKDFYDERLYNITPPDAYHKHDCLAVLGRGEGAIRQLSDWVDKLNELGAVVEDYETGATGIQAIFSGINYGKSMDIGIDVAYKLFGEYRPFSIDEIISILDKKEVEYPDHHDKNTNVR